MDATDFTLLNAFQRDFPLAARPYAELARRCACTEARVIERLARLASIGAVSRVGATIAPNRIGRSTLFALSIPSDRIEAAAACIGRHPEVNHSYERQHDYNLWAVAAAPDEAALARVLARIRAETGSPLLDLRLMEEYRIDLGFDLTQDTVCPAAPRPTSGTIRLQDDERALVAALQAGLPLVSTPYRELAAQIGWSESEVIRTLTRWIEVGLIRRFGVIVRHRELGYRANAMAVWDVPDDAIDLAGRRLAGQPGVTLAYRRRRIPQTWPYNLFCMVHGKEQTPVLARVHALAQACGLSARPHAVLFSTRRFKQTGARYVVPTAEPAHG